MTPNQSHQGPGDKIGRGKTTTAMAYVQQYKGEYAHIAWVEQLKDFATDLTTNTLLDSNLDVLPTDNPEADAQKIPNRQANLRGPSLLVIDNAT